MHAIKFFFPRDQQYNKLLREVDTSFFPEISENDFNYIKMPVFTVTLKTSPPDKSTLPLCTEDPV